MRGGEGASVDMKPLGPEVGGGRGSPREDWALPGLPSRRDQAAWAGATEGFACQAPRTCTWLGLSGFWGPCPQTCSPLPSPAPQGTTPFPLPLVQPQDWIRAFTATPVGPPSYIRPLEVPQLLPLGHFRIKCASVWPISPFCEMHADTAMPSSARPPPHPGLSGSPHAGSEPRPAPPP